MNQIERIEKISKFLKQSKNAQREFEISLENFKNSQKDFGRKIILVQ